MSTTVFDAPVSIIILNTLPSIEAGISRGWEKYVGSDGTSISIEKFGASAPGKIVLEKYGFNVENVVKHAKKLLNN